MENIGNRRLIVDEDAIEEEIEAQERTKKQKTSNTSGISSRSSSNSLAIRNTSTASNVIDLDIVQPVRRMKRIEKKKKCFLGNSCVVCSKRLKLERINMCVVS